MTETERCCVCDMPYPIWSRDDRGAYCESCSPDDEECKFCGSTTGHRFNCGQGGGR